MPRTLTPEERMDLEVTLDSVKMHQTDLWMALSDLEGMLEHDVELDANTDYENYTVEHLLEMEDAAAAEGTIQ